MGSGSLVGTWRLTSFELRAADGAVSHPYGPEVTGFLVYTADGYMCAAFGSADRGAESSGDLAQAGSAANYDAFMSYSGPYEVDGDRVIHHVEVSSLQVWTGTIQERVFQVEGDCLSLVTMPLQVASESPTAHLIWSRAADLSKKTGVGSRRVPSTQPAAHPAPRL